MQSEQIEMQKLILSGSPHVRSNNTTKRVMSDVLIALVPALIAGVYFFGAGALGTVALSIASAVGCEALIQYVSKRAITINDLSAVVTGLLLALNLPPDAPWYLPVCGSAFAIIIAKQLFGGLGHNFINPALAGRAFLMISWPVAMTSFILPHAGPDAVATATPLAQMAVEGMTPPGLMDMFIGNINGCIGETSVLALLIGAGWLFARKVISARIPVSYIGTVAVIALIAGLVEGDLSLVPYHLFAGGLMLGAFFMATDYSSSPLGKKAQIIFGIGCGGMTMVIRLFGGYPEGVSFSILFMNLLAPLLDRVFKTRIYGEVKPHVEK